MGEYITLEEIRKVYNPGENEVEALRGITFNVSRGEFIAIVGSSGSGKSTLMNILGCLDVPSGGRYLLDDVDVATLTDDELSEIRNKKIGFIFQGFNLVPSLNAVENVELPLAYRGIHRSERRELAVEALTQVGLASRLYHLPAQMSGGQQQRVAIARAIAARPPVILADEPTGNLDTASGSAVMETLWDLNREGKTIILITHDPSISAGTPRVIRVSDGQIVDSAGA